MHSTTVSQILRAMNALEQEIQCTLFVRTNRGVQLTPEGQQLYVRVSAAMTQLQAAEDELTKSASLEYGSISIGASEIALNIYLLHRLRQFHIDYPKVRLKIANHSTPQAIQSLKSGEIDFAVVTTPLTVTSPLIQVNLQPFQDILVGGTTFRPLQQKILSISELKNYPFICLGVNTATRHFYDELFSLMVCVWSRILKRPRQIRFFPWSKMSLDLLFFLSQWLRMHYRTIL